MNRIQIRRFIESDLADIRTLMSHAEAMRYTGFRVPQTEDQIQELLKKWMTEIDTALGVWAVEHIETKEFVGWAMLRKIDYEHPELGFMLPASQWSRGYATEIGKKMIEYGFSQPGIVKIIAKAHRDNLASIKVLIKLGMQQCADSPETIPKDAVRFEIARA